MKHIYFYVIKNGIRYPFLYYTGTNEEGKKIKVWMSNPKNRAKFKSREDFRKYCGDYFLINGDIGDGVVVSPEDIQAEVNREYYGIFGFIGILIGGIFWGIGGTIFGGFFLCCLGYGIDTGNRREAHIWNTKGTHFKK